MRHPMIDYVTRNIYGAWTICGLIGIRQYYGYTKQEACKKYKQECKDTIVINQD